MCYANLEVVVSYIIALSVGHHADAQGAVYRGTTEYALALQWIPHIASLIPYPTHIVTGTLKQKVKEINDLDEAVMAIELHFNSAKEDDDSLQGWRYIGKGSETLYYPKSLTGMSLAMNVQKRLGEIMQPSRGIKEGWYRMNPENGADFFLARTKCPAIIVEPEFIHRQPQIHDNATAACSAIARGIIEYYTKCLEDAVNGRAIR